MTAANFAPSIEFVFAVEGGYVDDPRDPGGATNMGITLRTLTTWRHTAVSKADVQALGKDEASAIYRALFWNAVHGDVLPSGIELMVFDYAVGSGQRRSIAALQTLVGVATDGALGPLTLAALAKLDASELIPKLAAEREAFYRSLSNFAIYGHGWLNRVSHCTAIAKQLVSVPAPAPSPPQPSALRASLLAWIDKELPA